MTAVALCPACVGTSDATDAASRAAPDEVILALPNIHCIACISGVEKALNATLGVAHARVNLSQKRATVTLSAPVAPEHLVEVLALAGHTALPMDTALLSTLGDATLRGLLTRIAVAGFAMMNVMLLSVAVWSGAAGETEQLFHLISACITLPALAYSASPFARNAFQALRAGRLNMDVPITLAIVLAAGMSAFETLFGGQQAYFDAALSLTFFLLIGRYLDQRGRQAAKSAAAQLAALEVPRVMRLHNGARDMVNFTDLRVGDLILVLPGSRIPVDGVVVEGESLIDRSMLTGESQPSTASPDSAVVAGEMALSGPLTIRARTVGADTTLRRMVTMVDQAEAARNRYTAIADRAARIYAPAVHLLALAAFLCWFMVSGDVRLSLNIAIAVLIITCPCALGLAVPAVATTVAGRLFRAGVLVKDGTAMERLAEVDTVVLDKTGTLTRPFARNDLLSGDEAQVALALASGSNHPVSVAIAASMPDATAADVTDIREVSGKGVSGLWHGQTVRLGSGDWLGQAPGTWVQIGDAAHRIALASDLRDGAAALVAGWQAQGLDVQLLSGDSAAETRAVAARLGIPTWRAEVGPDQKQAYVQALGDAGGKVLMVGDGLNDTGALAAAHASIAPASASDAARVAADIVLLRDDLTPLIPLPALARLARRRVLQNFAIAAGYNMVAIPIALAGFATPLLAAVAMSLSSLCVIANALRIRGAQ